MKFNDILREELSKRGWSADRAAREIAKNGGDVTAAGVSKWANGGSLPNLRHGKPLCETFKISPKRLLDAAANQAEAA